MSMIPDNSDQSTDLMAERLRRTPALIEVEFSLFWSICLGIFMLHLPPSITSNDAGELSAAAFELGIAHPPGFPIFSILTNAVMNLIGLGDIGFRGNLTSAILAAFALSFVFFSLRSRGGGLLETWCFGLIAAFSPLFLVHALTTEVYSGAACIIAMSVELLLRYRESKDVRYLYVLAVLMGLGGLGHHPIIRLVGVLFSIFVLPISGLAQGIRAFIIALSVGLMTLVFLPIRSGALPTRDWGAPRNLDGFIDHLLASRIRDSYGKEMWQFDLDTANTLMSQLLESSPVLIGAFVVGLMLVHRLAPAPLMRIYLSLLSLDLFYGLLINPMGIKDIQNGWLITLTLFPIATATMGHLKRFTPKFARTMDLVLIMLVLWSAAHFYRNQGYSNANPWQVRLSKLVELIAPESIVFATSDSVCASLAYLQVAEGRRPDIAVVVRQHLFRDSSTGPTHRRLPEVLKGWSPNSSLENLDNLHSGHPLLWEWIEGYDQSQMPPLTEASFPFFARGQNLSKFDIQPWLNSPKETLWSQTPAFAQREALFNVSLKSQLGLSATEPIVRFLKLWPTNEFMWLRLAGQLTREGQLNKALETIDSSIELFGLQARFVEQKLRILIRLKKFDEGKKLGTKFTSAKPKRQAEIYALVGICEANLGDYVQAKLFLEKALQLNPTQSEASSALPRVINLIDGQSGHD